MTEYGVAYHGDKWRISDGYRSCEHCGSMHPDDLFAAIEAGAMITGTDKNYKIYVEPAHPDPDGMRVVSATRDAHRRWGNLDEWVEITDENRHLLKGWGDDYRFVMLSKNGPTAHAKFYFEHLDDAAQARFVELYNAKKINLEPKFGLYVSPFFMRFVKKEQSQ